MKTNSISDPLSRARLSLWAKFARIVCKSLYDDPLFEVRTVIGQLVEAVSKLSFADGRGNPLLSPSDAADVRRMCAALEISEDGYREIMVGGATRESAPIDLALSDAVQCAIVLNEKFLLGRKFYAPPPLASKPPLPLAKRVSAARLERAYAMTCLARGIRYGEVPLGDVGLGYEASSHSSIATTREIDADVMAWNLEKCIVRTPAEYAAMQVANIDAKKEKP